MTDLYVKCVHGSLVRHGHPPVGVRDGEYVAAHRLVWCNGPTKVEIDFEAAHDSLVSWGDSIMQGPEGYYGSRIAVSEILNAALGITVSHSHYEIEDTAGITITDG